MKLEQLDDLYADLLRDLYSAEKLLLKALPKMAKAASSPELREAFNTHRDQTEEHVERLKRIFEKIGGRAGGKECKAMVGLIEEGQELLDAKDDADPAVLDAGLIAAAQKIEHYEIGGYGTARSFARILGDEDSAEILQETLDEEGETDKLLTSIAERINFEAADAEEEEAEEGTSRKAAGRRSRSSTRR